MHQLKQTCTEIPLCAWWVICLSVPARQFRQSVCSPGADTGSDWCGGIGIETICLGNEELSFMAPQTWFKLLLFVVTCLPRGIKDKSSFIIPWIPHINSLPSVTKHNLSFEHQVSAVTGMTKSPAQDFTCLRIQPLQKRNSIICQKSRTGVYSCPLPQRAVQCLSHCSTESSPGLLYGIKVSSAAQPWCLQPKRNWQFGPLMYFDF